MTDPSIYPSREDVNEARDKAHKLRERCAGREPGHEAVAAYLTYRALVRRFPMGRVPAPDVWWALPTYVQFSTPTNTPMKEI